MSDFIIEGTLVKYTGDSADVTIPEGVTNISKYAFRDLELSNVIIPKSVVSIKKWAFHSCKLNSIVISENVTSIDEDAFRGCTISHISVADKNPIYHSKNNCLIETETNRLILGCESSIIPNYVTSIGDGAFHGCTELTSIEIPENVTNIESSFAFSCCKELSHISVAEKNPIYHSKDNCLIETKTNQLVLGCKSSIIPDYVTSIGEFAFQGCAELTSIVIPDSVTEIAFAAFSDCSKLSSIIIPKSVTSIHTWAFDEWSKITIKAPKDSYAEQYANNCNFAFESL